jgi:undecaprenyl-diphosphatase
MTWWHAVLLGLLQGITEFLPISSSGHLVLAQHFLGFNPQPGGDRGMELFFDGCLHLGTAVAVVLYFWKRLRNHFQCAVEEARWPRSGAELLRLTWLVCLATIPATLVAVLYNKEIARSFEQPRPVAVNFIFLGLLLVGVEWLRRRRVGQVTGVAMTSWQAAVIGLAQAGSAVFRGLSRSGMTIGGALLVGLERTWAVNFSFMMAVVASAGLGALGIGRALLKAGGIPTWLTGEFLASTLLGTIVAGLVGYLTIDVLIALVQRSRLSWFAAYLWAVAAAVLVSLPD